MAVTTSLESKYVVLARLYTFLNTEFPGQYSVKVIFSSKPRKLPLPTPILGTRLTVTSSKYPRHAF